MAGEPNNTLSIQSSKELIGTSTGTWIGRTSMIELADGTWIQTYRAAGLHTGDATAQIHVRFSANKGVDWSAEDKLPNGNAVVGFPIVEHDTGNAGVGSGELAICPNGDLLCLVVEVMTGVVKGTWQYRSTDDGATWTDEGQINSDATLVGDETVITIGTDMYLAAWKQGVGANKSCIYKSSDNAVGALWTFVSDITDYSDNTDECTIINPSGNTLISVIRQQVMQLTYWRVSNDLGVTWGNLMQVPYVGVLQRPKLKIFADEPNRIYLIARRYYPTYEKTVITYTDNSCEDWVAPLELESDNPTDCAYCDALKRDDGSIYLLSYKGAGNVTDIYEYVIGQ